MTQDLDYVVVIAGSGVPEHMIGRLREHGMIVVSAPDGMSMSEDALRVGIDLGARPSEFYYHPHQAPVENAGDAFAYMMGGIRAGKTAATEDRLAALDRMYGAPRNMELRLVDDMVMIDRLAALGSPRLSPPRNLGRTSDREIVFINTPKPITKRKARRNRGRK